MKIISDEKLGEFILGCMKTTVACKKLSKEIDTMCEPICIDCKKPLSDEEIWEAQQNGLNIKEVSCDKCWSRWVKDKMEETKHPDNEGV